MTITSTLTITVCDQVQHIQLNQAASHHRLSVDMMDELMAQFQSPSTRVIVISASGPVFCAGADLRWMQDRHSDAPAHKLAALLEAMDHCPVPIAIAVTGDVYGGGLGLLACADIVFSNELAQYCFSEAKLGLVPALISPYILRAVGFRQLKPLVISANLFTAHHAAQIGLIHQVSQTALDDAFHWAKQTLACGPNAIKQIKWLCRELTPISQQHIQETHALLNVVRKGDEAQAGIEAFLQKQRPPWDNQE
ncbi:enoyl-CoA hydratase-related protein [Thaumasiovibrio sp. DFM-14]|uniref:enoyl-CoA hydratase-related protein n=1 Tax=Thaumasiovibrio sp. DFM-14 TaxID=3384792 RepID=UPI0039A1F576